MYGDAVYDEMNRRLKAVEGLEYDDDAVISIWLGSLEAYNAGRLIGRWISLPCDEDALRQAYNIVTHDGRHDFYIADYAGAFQGNRSEYADPFELNEMAEALEDLDDIEIAVVSWLMKDHDYDLDDALEKRHSVQAGSKDSIADEYLEMLLSGYAGGLEIFANLYNYFDMDYVWNDIEHSAATHQHDYETWFVYWWD